LRGVVSAAALFTRPAIPPWILFFGAATVSAALKGVIDGHGLLAVAVFALLALTSVRSSRAEVRQWSMLATVALAFGLALHLVPGFGSSVFVSEVRLSLDALPMWLAARFDAGVAGLFLLALYCRRVRTLQELRAMLPSATAIAGVTTIVVIGLALLAGYVRPDPKWPAFTLAFLAKMLFFTAVLEEAFFRGIVQDRLASAPWISSSPGLKWLPLAVSSILFGLAHAPGGWALAGLATVAGVGYGLAYAVTGRIEAAIAVHFTVNAVHFVGFTYPRLA
jgi:membrane protease YdiL (CAAX protease family)